VLQEILLLSLCFVDDNREVASRYDEDKVGAYIDEYYTGVESRFD